MNNSIKKMAVGVFLMSSVISSAMSVKERARMFEQAAQQEAQRADQREIKKVGKLAKDLGYVSKEGAAVTADFARKRSLDRARRAVDNIAARLNNVQEAQDILYLVARNKQRIQRGERELDPMASQKPHVIFLTSTLEGLSLDEQIELLKTLQNEFALKAAAAAVV